MTDNGKPARRGERGYVLLTALLTLMAVSAICARLIFFARTGTENAAARQEAAMLDAAAEGAVSKTIFALLRVDPHRRELETVFQMPAPGARAIVRVWDLDGLINPNMASPALLRAMLDAAGANETQAAAIVRAILDTRGAETGGVTLASATNRPPPRPFASLADFAAVPGMTGALMDVLTPHVGVWGPALPDPGLAAPLVRQALTQSGEMAFAGTVRPDEKVLRLEATVAGPRGRLAVRRAVVRLGLGLDGLSWHVLAWDRPPP